MINVNTIDIKHCQCTSVESPSGKDRETVRHAEKLEDAIIDGLFTVSTVRYDNEKWPQGDLDCLGDCVWQRTRQAAQREGRRERERGRHRERKVEKLELLPSSCS